MVAEDWLKANKDDILGEEGKMINNGLKRKALIVFRVRKLKSIIYVRKAPRELSWDVLKSPS